MTRGVRSKPQAKGKARAKAAAPSNDARAVRAEVSALSASDRPDLARLAECFESLRDRTEQPARLFALAVEEAAVLDALFERSREKKSLRAAIAAHRRVLDGSAQSARAAGVAASIASVERMLRSKIARELDASERHLARFAVMKGHLILGDHSSARRLLERLSRDSADLPTRAGLRDAAREAVYTRGFELAIEDRDHADALRWATRQADLRATNRDAQASGAYADALAPIPSLCLEVGQLSRAFEQAQSWVAAERIAAARGAERTSRIIEALQAVALAAAVGASGPLTIEEDRLQALDSAVQFTEAAVAATGASSGLDAFAHARAAEAVSTESALRMQFQSRDGSRLELLAAHARTLGEPSLYLNVQVARLVRAANDDDWRSAATFADELLEAAPECPPDVLAIAVRAHFALGHDAQCAVLADRYLALANGDTDPAEMARILALGTASADRSFDRTDDLERDALARAQLAAVHALEKRMTRFPTLARDAPLRAALLASRAMVEQRCELESIARRDAQEAVTKIRNARGMLVETGAFVAYVHERVASPDARRRVDLAGLDVISAPARALAAAERDDTARAASLLNTVSIESLQALPSALGNTLAALTRTLERLAPNDPLLAEGFATWRDVCGWATLPAARGYADVLGLNTIPENGVDAASSRG